MKKLKRAKLRNVKEEDESCERRTKRGYRMRLNEASKDDGVGLATLSWPFKLYPFSPSHTVFQEITHE